MLVGSNIITATAQPDKEIDNRAIDSLDLKKYVGLWYEIARFDHPFERGLVGVTTQYIIKPDGNIEVIGCGYQDSLRGEKKEIVGKVRIPDTTGNITGNILSYLQHGLPYPGSRERLQRRTHRELTMRSSLDREPHTNPPSQKIKRFGATGQKERL